MARSLDELTQLSQHIAILSLRGLKQSGAHGCPFICWLLSLTLLVVCRIVPQIYGLLCGVLLLRLLLALADLVGESLML